MQLKIVMTIICSREPQENDEHFAQHYDAYRAVIDRNVAAGASLQIPGDRTTIRWLIAGRSIAAQPSRL